MLKRFFKKAFLLLVMIICLGATGKKYSESFRVVILKDHYKVYSPLSFKTNRAILFENKTLANIVGKIVDHNDKIIIFVTIMPGEFKRVRVHNSQNDQLRFIPLSPAFQEVKFMVGQKYYEIPPQR